MTGNRSVSDDLVKRLHGVMRPFVLRRLKKDVEKQMPGKFEHIVKCPLSRRQQYLYEEYMGRSATRAAMGFGGESSSGGGKGNFMGMMNVLMQVDKGWDGGIGVGLLKERRGGDIEGMMDGIGGFRQLFSLGTIWLYTLLSIFNK